MKFLSALVVLASLSLSACAQVPPASPGYNVQLTGTLPTVNSCTAIGAAPCTFAFYGETVAAGASCDPVTSTNYKEISNPSSRPTTPNFTDPNTTGLTRCYNVETVQSGANSAPSNNALVVSPGIPSPLTLAPSVVVALLDKPPSEPTFAYLALPPVMLRASFIKR